METFIIRITAKPGHDAEVTRFYKAQGDLLEKSDGFLSRTLYRSRNGAMAKAVRKAYTAEELAKHAEPPHEDPGTVFIIVEHWESVDHRIAFGKNNGQRNVELFPHLAPEHSHEFYDDFTS